MGEKVGNVFLSNGLIERQRMMISKIRLWRECQSSEDYGAGDRDVDRVGVVAG